MKANLYETNIRLFTEPEIQKKNSRNNFIMKLKVDIINSKIKNPTLKAM